MSKNIKISHFFEKLQKYPTFLGSLVPLYSQLRGTLKSDKIFVFIVPL